jgi:hypothetical protein
VSFFQRDLIVVALVAQPDVWDAVGRFPLLFVDDLCIDFCGLDVLVAEQLGNGV